MFVFFYFYKIKLVPIFVFFISYQSSSFCVEFAAVVVVELCAPTEDNILVAYGDAAYG